MRPGRGGLSTGRRGRLHVLLLGIIAAVGLVRGLYWAAVTVVFNPVDEAAHFAYVESMARDLRPPVVGEDRLSADALGLVKEARTSYWRGMPVPPSPDDDRWGAAAESYEGVQGPLYYLVMAVPFRLTRPFGVLASLYGVRVGSVVLSLLAVPLAYLLARELFPGRRQAWLAAPALLVVLQGFNGNTASVTNDALVVPLAAATLLAFARSAGRGLDRFGAALTGGLVGLGLATKSNMVALVPLIGMGAVAVAVGRRVPWQRVLSWAAVAGLAAAAAVAPWAAWNLSRYGALSASEEVDRITGPMQPDVPFGVDGVREHLVGSTVGFWDFQAVGSRLGRYAVTVTIAASVVLVAGIAAALVRRRLRDAAVLGWLGISYAVVLATMLAVIYGVFAGRSSTVGRHMYPALVAVVVAVVAAAFLIGRRVGWVALAAVASVALAAEPAMVDRMVELTYTNNVIGRLTPVVDQSYGDRVSEAPSFTVESPCPAEALGVGLAGAPPASLAVTTAGGRGDAAFLGLQGTPVQRIAVYTLPAPVSGRLDVGLSGLQISASTGERERRLSLAGETGDPVARVFCPVDDPEEARFRQQFSPDHPSWITLGQVRAWPRAWVWSGWLALTTAAAVPIVARVRSRRAEEEPK